MIDLALSKVGSQDNNAYLKARMLLRVEFKPDILQMTSFVILDHYQGQRLHTKPAAITIDFLVCLQHNNTRNNVMIEIENNQQPLLEFRGCLDPFLRREDLPYTCRGMMM